MSIQQRELDKFLGLLKGLNAQFKIVIPDGDNKLEYGDLAVIQHKRVARVPRGSCLKVYESAMKKLAIGNVVAIPFNDLPVESIRSSICSWAIRTWGLGSVTTMINRDNNTIEVLRNY
jgi:hypothetical protein